MARPKGSKDSIKRKPRKLIMADKMVGNHYNRWFVISVYSKGKQPRINVRCDCGIEKHLTSFDVYYGNSKSCGCYHKDEMSKRQRKTNNESAKRRLFNSYKSGAKVRNIEFNLTFEQVIDIALKDCYFCGQIPNREIITVGGRILTNGIDRVINEIGYQKDNCVPCCKKCNLHKNDIPIYIARKMVEFVDKKETDE